MDVHANVSVAASNSYRLGLRRCVLGGSAVGVYGSVIRQVLRGVRHIWLQLWRRRPGQ